MWAPVTAPRSTRAARRCERPWTTRPHRKGWPHEADPIANAPRFAAAAGRVAARVGVGGSWLRPLVAGAAAAFGHRRSAVARPGQRLLLAAHPLHRQRGA